MSRNETEFKVIDFESAKERYGNLREILGRHLGSESELGKSEKLLLSPEETATIILSGNFVHIHLAIEAMLASIKMEEVALKEGSKRWPKEIVEWFSHDIARDREFIFSIDRSIREIEEIYGFPSEQFSLESYERELDKPLQHKPLDG